MGGSSFLLAALSRQIFTVLFFCTILLAQSHPEAQSKAATPAGEIYRKASPAVVLIQTYDEKGNAKAAGSGFLIGADGKILTNHHVIAHSRRATVRLANGDAYDWVEVLDMDKRRDIALIKIRAVGLPFLSLGESKSVDVGDPVFSLSTPLGLLQNTLSDGIVSGIREGDGYRYFQVTAPISHGSSGGPIFNVKGEVIGIAVATISEGQNLNFAIPIDYAKGMLASSAQPKPLAAVYEPEPGAETTKASASEKVAEPRIEVTIETLPNGFRRVLTLGGNQDICTSVGPESMRCEKYVRGLGYVPDVTLVAMLAKATASNGTRYLFGLIGCPPSPSCAALVPGNYSATMSGEDGIVISGLVGEDAKPGDPARHGIYTILSRN
jgi:S1-C subfamily serine protease